MNIREFIRKESFNHISDVFEGDIALMESSFDSGLTRGLELAKEFTEWTQRNRYKQEGGKKGKGEWYVQAAGYGGGEPKIYTTTELLTIFLTEKYS